MSRIAPFVDLPELESLDGRAYCRANAAAADELLVGLAAEAIGDQPLALVAVGGYGRGELAPGSDLDLVLLHARGVDPGPVAEKIWYPLWDRRLKLGHAVHTPTQAAQLATEEIERLTAFSSMRTLAGRLTLTAELTAGIDRVWRQEGDRALGELHRLATERHRRHGSVAHRLEPELKEGRGGLRDLHALLWADRGRPGFAGFDLPSLDDAYGTLLDVRVALHLQTGRSRDRLNLEDQEDVAAALGLDGGFALMERVAEAAQTIAWFGDEAWGRWARSVTRPRGGWETVVHDEHALETDGQIQLVTDADPTDPRAILDLSVAAARSGRRLARVALETLADAETDLPEPWPPELRDRLVDLLREGRSAIPVVESLDQFGLLERLVPEWARVRCRPQRNALHTFTVDRHLLEAAANAAELADRIDEIQRPDLLVMGAWLHDIGKGFPGDHTEVGMEVITDLAARIGYPPDDVEVLVRLCEHHLLLSDVAVRRNLDDPGTVVAVADAVRTTDFLRLLTALTEADSRATGPSVWGPWKSERLDELSRRVAAHLDGRTTGFSTTGLSPGTDEHLRAGRRTVHGEGDRLSVVVDDEPFLFGRLAGALAISGLEVVEASAHSEASWAASEFVIRSDDPVDWERVVDQVDAVLAGRVALTARVAARAEMEAPFQRSLSAEGPERRIEIDHDLSPVATVIDVHAPDRVGLLYELARTFGELHLDIRSATVQTITDQAVDSFYVVDREGRKLDEAGLTEEVRFALQHCIAG